MRLRLLQVVNSYLLWAKMFRTILVNVVMAWPTFPTLFVLIFILTSLSITRVITTFTRIAHDKYELTVWRSLSLIKIYECLCWRHSRQICYILHVLLVELPVDLCPESEHSSPVRPIECLVGDGCFVADSSTHSIQGIHFSNKMACRNYPSSSQ